MQHLIPVKLCEDRTLDIKLVSMALGAQLLPPPSYDCTKLAFKT